MPHRKLRVPALVHHKPTGQARVRIAGRDLYLGRYGTPEADERYRRIVAEFVTSGGLPEVPTTGPAAIGISVNELILAYLPHAERYYRKNGRATSELPLIRHALRLLRQHYGMTPAAEFGPLRLKALRKNLIDRSITRKSINQRIGRVKRLFKWGVENELVPPSVYHGLSAVPGLRKGRDDVVESTPVKPVADTDVNAILPFLNRQHRAMVQLEALTGMRPGEVCAIRPSEVDRDRDVWEYRPGSHKTEHHDRERVVYIGPRGQQVLAPWLDNRPADAFCFSPAEAIAERRAAKRAVRKTPVQPSQQNRRTARPKRKPGERYTTMSYGHAIKRACEKAGVEAWAPNRLRHSKGTKIRKLFGIEAVQVSFGHADVDVSEVYAERDAELGRRVALETG